MLRETSALPSFTQCDDVSHCLGRIIGSNSVDVRVECFIMTPFGCQVTRTSHAVMCVSTETQKNVTNHRGQSQNKQSSFKRTCPTCELGKGMQRRLESGVCVLCVLCVCVLCVCVVCVVCVVCCVLCVCVHVCFDFPTKVQSPAPAM